MSGRETGQARKYLELHLPDHLPEREPEFDPDAEWKAEELRWRDSISRLQQDDQRALRTARGGRTR